MTTINSIVVPTAPTASGDSLDPFKNLEALRMDQQFGADLGLKRVLTNARHGKPGRHDWVKRHSDQTWTLQTALFHFEDDGKKEAYLVAPPMRDVLVNDLKPALLCAAISRAGDPFIWEVPLPGLDGSPNTWNESMRSAAAMALDRWIRVASNMRTKSYDVTVTKADFPVPEWPVATFEELLRLAYKDRYIDSPEHPIVRKLSGEL